MDKHTKHEESPKEEQKEPAFQKLIDALEQAKTTKMDSPNGLFGKEYEAWQKGIQDGFILAQTMAQMIYNVEVLGLKASGELKLVPKVEPKEKPPAESQETLWNEVWELIISGKAGNSENKLSYVESKFHLTRK